MPLFKHFTLDDFDCKCCGRNWAKVEFIQELDKLQDAHLPHRIRVINGYRCWKHNQEVGGARNSRHLHGDGADLTSDNVEDLYLLCCARFKAVGDGRARGFVHVDLRKDKERRWTY